MKKVEITQECIYDYILRVPYLEKEAVKILISTSKNGKEIKDDYENFLKRKLDEKCTEDGIEHLKASAIRKFFDSEENIKSAIELANQIDWLQNF